MKRDMDLIRKLLFALEELSDVSHAADGAPNFRVLSFHGGNVKVKGYTDDEVDYNLVHMEEMGLLVSNVPPIARGIIDGIGFERLSSKGCDYLDALRDDNVWTKTKDIAVKAGVWSLDGVKQIAIEVASDFAAATIRKSLGMSS